MILKIDAVAQSGSCWKNIGIGRYPYIPALWRGVWIITSVDPLKAVDITTKITYVSGGRKKIYKKNFSI